MEHRIEAVHSCGSDVCASRRSSLRTVLAHLLMLATCLTAGAAAADELSLLINGKAIHMNNTAGNKLNEKNWGLGLQYDWDRVSKNWIPFATVSGFRDSNRNTSYYAGGGVMQRFQFEGAHLDLGAVGFLMTREGYKNDEPSPGILPALSVGTKRVALNITYVPKVEPKAVPLWYFQLKINLGRFR